MSYDAKKDFRWLFIRPWIWIPRIIQITTSILIFCLNLFLKGTSQKEEIKKSLSEDLFKTLTQLGPCFIKIGQALSTRPDLISSYWLESLTKLQDSLPAFSHQEAILILEKELGNRHEEIFKIFPDKPIASASLGVVYKALLPNNKWVAVKIQRPNLPFLIRRDLVIIRLIGILSSPFLPLNLGFGLGEIIDEFGISLFKEIDYKLEADNAEKFSSLFYGNSSIKIPSVERIYSSKKVVTTSWINGVKLKSKEVLEENGIDPKLIIKTAVISGIQQLLEFGYFHADPHPGNMFALRGSESGLSKLAYVDFGMMDSISEKDRLTLTGAIVHLINNDFYSLSKDFQELGFLNKSEDLTNITPVIKQVLGNVLSKEVGSFNLRSVTNKFSELMYNYPFRVPSRFALIIRAVVSQEGLALKLDPSFKIIRFAYPYVAKRLLTDQNEEMVNILVDILFDSNGYLQTDRLEDLLDVIVQDSGSPSKDLIPVARDGIKLLISPKGDSIRTKLLLSLIKDERINTKEIKTLIKLIAKKLKPNKLINTKSLKQRLDYNNYKEEIKNIIAKTFSNENRIKI